MKSTEREKSKFKSSLKREERTKQRQKEKRKALNVCKRGKMERGIREQGYSDLKCKEREKEK